MDWLGGAFSLFYSILFHLIFLVHRLIGFGFSDSAANPSTLFERRYLGVDKMVFPECVKTNAYGCLKNSSRDISNIGNSTRLMTRI